MYLFRMVIRLQRIFRICSEIGRRYHCFDFIFNTWCEATSLRQLQTTCQVAPFPWPPLKIRYKNDSDTKLASTNAKNSSHRACSPGSTFKWIKAWNLDYFFILPIFFFFFSDEFLIFRYIISRHRGKLKIDYAKFKMKPRKRSDMQNVSLLPSILRSWNPNQSSLCHLSIR